MSNMGDSTTDTNSILEDLKDYAEITEAEVFEGFETGLPRFGLRIDHVTGEDFDSTIWNAFVQHRNALAKIGLRLTMPEFDENGFVATIQRIRPEHT